MHFWIEESHCSWLAQGACLKRTSYCTHCMRNWTNLLISVPRNAPGKQKATARWKDSHKDVLICLKSSRTTFAFPSFPFSGGQALRSGSAQSYLAFHLNPQCLIVDSPLDTLQISPTYGKPHALNCEVRYLSCAYLVLTVLDLLYKKYFSNSFFSPPSSEHWLWTEKPVN